MQFILAYLFYFSLTTSPSCLRQLYHHHSSPFELDSLFSFFRICSKPASHIAWGDVEPWRVLGSKAPPDCFAESSCPQIVTFCAHVRLRCRDIHTLYYAIHPSSILVRDLRLDIFFRFLVLLWGDTQSCPSARNQASVFVNYLQAQGFNFFSPFFTRLIAERVRVSPAPPTRSLAPKQRTLWDLHGPSERLASFTRFTRRLPASQPRTLQPATHGFASFGVPTCPVPHRTG